KQALLELQKLGLLARDGEGNLVKASAHLSTDQIVSATLAKCHKELISRASESIDRFPREQREISAHTFRFSQAGIAKIKDVVQKFRAEILEIASQEASPDMVCQLNVQFFPIAISEGRSSK